jgi:hypothetical protein
MGSFFYKILNCSDDISLFVVIPIAILNFQMLLIETGDLRHGFDQWHNHQNNWNLI